MTASDADSPPGPALALGQWLRGHREFRAWSRTDMQARLRAAAAQAGDVLPQDDTVVRMIRAWEAGEGISERYRLHYCRALNVPLAGFGRVPVTAREPAPGADPPPGPALSRGQWLRLQRQARGWSVPETIRRLRESARQAGETLPGNGSLGVMIRRWEKDDGGVSERYRSHFCRAFKIPLSEFGRVPVRPAPASDPPPPLGEGERAELARLRAELAALRAMHAELAARHRKLTSDLLARLYRAVEEDGG